MNVSIPHRYGKNSVVLCNSMKLHFVSIPHRYGKNVLYNDLHKYGFYKVSIPHRYGKNMYTYTVPDSGVNVSFHSS